MLFAKWNTDDGNTENQSYYGMFKCKPNAAQQEPYQIHTSAEASSGILLISHFPAKGPQGKRCTFEKLNAEWNTNNGDTPN